MAPGSAKWTLLAAIVLFLALDRPLAVASGRTGYPPPPGPYRGDTDLRATPGDSARKSGRPIDKDTPTIGTGSRLLPLPDAGPGGPHDTFSASNLFGSPARSGPVATDSPLKPSGGPRLPPASQKAAPATTAERTTTTNSDLSMDVRRTAPAAQMPLQRPAWQQRPQPGLPPYAAAYPGPYAAPAAPTFRGTEWPLQDALADGGRASYPTDSPPTPDALDDAAAGAGWSARETPAAPSTVFRPAD